MDQRNPTTADDESDQPPGHPRKRMSNRATPANGHEPARPHADDATGQAERPRESVGNFNQPNDDEQILDQFADGAFDPLTRLAAHALHTPAALLVALDTEAPRVVSQFGLDAGPAPGGQRPLDRARWDAIIASAPGAFWGDAGERTWSLPRLRGGTPAVALAAARVVGEAGEVVAALCVLDDHPRVWTEQDRELLGDVATTVQERLALRRAVRQAEGRAETRLAVQYAVSRILVSATDFDTAAPRILHAVCEGLRWQLGAIWLVDEREETLRCAWTWHAPGVEVQAFERASRAAAFAPGVGIPGQVYASRASLWLSDLARASNFSRVSEAASVGLRSAFAFPIRGGGKALGVGEFFATETRPVDDDLIQNVATIGNQIGQFLIRQRAESAERASEARRGAIQDIALDAIVSIDARGAILEFNPMAEATFGYRRAEVIGKDIADILIPPSLRARHRHGLRRYLQTGEGALIGKHVELTAMRRDGSEFPVELAISAVPDGGSPAFIGVLRDITARRRAQEEHSWLLAEAQHARDESEAAMRRLASVQSVTDSALMHLALDSLLAELLQRIRGLLRVDNATILLLDEDGQYLTIRGVSGLEEEVEQGTRIAYGQGFAGRIAEFRVPLIVDDTSEFEIYSDILRERLRSLAGVPLLVNERVVGVLHVGAMAPRHFSRDDAELLQLVADRIALAIDHARLFQGTRRALRQVEEIARQLADQASHLDAMIEAIPHGVYVCDADGVRTRVNAHGAHLLGWPPELALQPLETFGVMNLPRSLDGERLEAEDYPLTRGLRGEIRGDIRLLCRRFDTGADLHILASCAPLRYSSGAITGAVSVFTDLTDFYRLERQKDDFLSIASHELKTPLTSLKILAQLTRRRLERAGLSESEHTVRMERAIARIERLVNDLLDASRIDSGRLALRRERADLRTICRAAAEDEMAATERSISLDLPERPVEVESDVDRMTQVLTNLLSNALKYSPTECAVTLTLRTEGNAAVIAVRDEGAGIPPESLPLLFER
ncbi:MAG TPA: GAF domain-containing protein, partial [Ktedonobacterales bacterium]|nr:GAF domain-containing protein [Ktedonobacterales bacterium]